MKAKAKSIAAACALGAFLVPAAFAQSGLVNVEIRNVANDIARNVNVDVSQIPVTVQVPVGVAATVCGVAASVLGTNLGSGNAACTARSTSQALDQVVLRQIKGNVNG